MKSRTTALPIILAASALAGCGGATTGTIATAPYADAYQATYASAAVDVMSKVLVNTGDTIEGGAAPVKTIFDTPDDRLDEPQSVKIEKADDGYILHAAGETVEFTSTELHPDGYYELIEKNMNGDDRTIGYFFPAFGTLADLEASDTAMVPLGYGVRVKDGNAPATADDADGFSEGYTIVGLETDPSHMPTTGSATYEGDARIEAYVKNADYNIDEPSRVRYRGTTKLNADFGAGTVAGNIVLKDSRVSHTQSGNGAVNDISANGAEIALGQADIIDNGFSSELTANAAAAAQMAADGISDDTEATAVGRFYGTDAGQIGAIVGGEGASHVITGVLAGERTP
ncbi:transferrin-binding protein-like solute binding protein [Nitratireductor luteus]|uniref:transferrin-binding protein-like solute binding protein n=1 Tax=Nitratireductor luteus TaxID=2976980 RepID=UPI0022401E85|nr:transferrin-binding protein-like solute binding protein [Nitratireductor luteus]